MPTEYFEQRERALLGQRYEQLYAAPQQTAERGVTVSALRTTPEQFAQRADFPLEPSPFCKSAFVVHQPDFKPGRHPYHHAGVFYSQEPSASSAAPLLGGQPGVRGLGMCAAPGGKSSQLAAALQGRGVLVSNEYVAARAEILKSNLERMGVSNAVVLNETPARIAEALPEFFDRVLVDAPCSGEGMFRKNQEARQHWSAKTVLFCHDRQLEILAQAAIMLRRGGRLVYSTCTFNDIENEGVLKRFLALHPEFTLQPFALPGLPEAKDGYLHLYPHEMRGEGHFVSRLNKSADTSETESPVQAAPKKKTSARPAASAKGKAPAPIALPDVFSDAFTPNRLYAAGDALWMLPEQISIERLHGLRVLRTGLLLAHAEGRRSEPDHALAMALRPKEAARTANLTIEQALAYQAGETLALGDLPGGYTLLCCEGVSLGWGKQAGGMMKNHYPKGLRRRN